MPFKIMENTLNEKKNDCIKDIKIYNYVFIKYIVDYSYISFSIIFGENAVTKMHCSKVCTFILFFPQEQTPDIAEHIHENCYSDI